MGISQTNPHGMNLHQNGATTNFTAIVNGNSSYTGSTNLEGGTTLRVNGTHSNAGQYTLNSTGVGTVTLFSTLGGSGTINGNVQVNSGNRLSPGNNSSVVGTLTVQGLSLDTTALLFEGSGGGFDRINVTGNNAFNVGGGTSTFTLSNLGGLAAGTYTLIDYVGSIQGNGFGSLALGTTSLGTLNFALSNNLANTSVDLVVTSTVVNANWT